MRRTVAVAACATLLACASVPPVQVPHRDGEIESLIPDSEDAFGRYLAIVYWSDGLKVKGYLGLPKASGRHPALIVNRGGVGGVGHAEPYHLWEWAEAGYVAVAPFYRGVGGSEGRDGYGGADVRDVLALVPLLESLPEVDASRIGMLGVDRGGMMTLLALAADGERGSRRFKAAITVGAATDLPALAAANPALLEPLHAAIGGGPREAPAAWAARSAVRWPGRLAGVPLLILHGEADERVPVAQARAFAEAVERAGGDVTLQVVPGDDHGLSRSDWGVPVMVRFFEKHLKAGATPP